MGHNRAAPPLLLQLAQVQQPSSAMNSVYDDQLDELLVQHGDDMVPAADLPEGPPITKKFDIEKGEDVKGRW